MKIKLGKIEQGRCPYCGSTDINYEPIRFEGDMLYYPATCNGCSGAFEEWYNLSFAGHNVGDNLDIEACEGMEITLKEEKNV